MDFKLPRKVLFLLCWISLMVQGLQVTSSVFASARLKNQSATALASHGGTDPSTSQCVKLITDPSGMRARGPQANTPW